MNFSTTILLLGFYASLFYMSTTNLYLTPLPRMWDDLQAATGLDVCITYCVEAYQRALDAIDVSGLMSWAYAHAQTVYLMFHSFDDHDFYTPVNWWATTFAASLAFCTGYYLPFLLFRVESAGKRFITRIIKRVRIFLARQTAADLYVTEQPTVTLTVWRRTMTVVTMWQLAVVAILLCLWRGPFGFYLGGCEQLRVSETTVFGFITFSDYKLIATHRTAWAFLYIFFALGFSAMTAYLFIMPELPNRDAERLMFRKHKMPPSKTQTDNPHGGVAGLRAAARKFVQTYAAKAGLEVVSYNSRGLKGPHNVCIPMDLKKPLYNGDVLKDHIVYVEDEDYHIDMPSFLRDIASQKCHGVILYTFTPEHLAKTRDEYSYHYVGDGLWKLSTCGGTTYTKSLWNWNTSDLIVVDDIAVQHVYTLDRKVIGTDRSLILIAPCGTNPGSSWTQNLGPMEILASPAGAHTIHRFEYFKDGKAWTSIASSEHPLESHTMPLKALYDVADRATRSSKTKIAITPSSIANTLERFGCTADEASAAASFLSLCLNAGWTLGLMKDHGYYIAVYEEKPHSYYLGPIPQDQKPSVHAVDAPILDRAAGPARGPEADLAFHKERVLDQTNNVTPPVKYVKFKNAFISHLGLHEQLTPYTFEEVFDKQAKPTQKAKNTEYGVWDTKSGQWSAFMKAESYVGKIAPPRQIASPASSHRVEYSKYTYPLYEHLKKFRWFGFSKTPTELADAVHTALAHADTVIPTDYSKWDGRHSRWLAWFELEILQRAFPQAEHKRIYSLWKHNYNLTMSTANVKGLTTQWHRPSGSPDTSVFNTLDNAFLAFCVIALEHGVDTAFERLGIYGGDDGLTPGVTEKMYYQVAKDFGLVLKAETLKTTGLVPFLGRYFVNPKFSTDSVIDLKRCLSKLHLTTDAIATKEEVYARKSLAFKWTDPKVPILRAFIQAYAPDETATLRADEGWWAHAAQTSGAGFPCAMSDLELMDFACQNLGIEAELVAAIEKALINGETPPQIPTHIEVGIGCIFRGDRVEKGSVVEN